MFIADFSKHYVLELTEREVKLKISDTESSAEEAVARMPLREVSFVEYFTPKDCASVVFHGKEGRVIKVPIWSLTDHPSPVLQFFKS